ncbi:MAG: cytochrome c biogenesis protein CcsA [Acidobacteriaceae bacterium]|nr:cytochrome c biogenesis protein CcsA [Acidobacteriaceae bacterium]MBV9781111.1 cytochrome c biogenesis protein CcsA [Acidobacteriaceae bacterium]
MRERLVIALAAIAALLLAYNLYHIFLVLPDEAAQGAIYRIIFFHVPAAITAFTGFFVTLVLSIMYLISGNLRYDSLAASVTEVGVVFACVNLVTGMIWARIIWGIWWTWDARLTSMLVCVLIYSGYLMLRRAIDEPTQRARLSAALSIFGFADVILVWKSIQWFRTQHPSPVLSIRTGGGNIDPAMEHMLYLNFLAILMIAAALVLVRTRQETMAREIDSLRRLANAA